MRKRVGTLCITAAILLNNAGCGTASGGKNEIRFSWWGGESRHKATSEAVNAFLSSQSEITVRCEYGAWSGWEDAAAAALYAGTEPDVMQVNWNWLTDYNSEQSGFLDLYRFRDIMDLQQYDTDVLEMCTVDGELRCIPVSETGRVFFWNASLYERAGIPVPDSFAALCDAGAVFREKLGDEYYPLALGWYDRMLFAVYYLQCKYGREWVTDGVLQYSEAELAEALGVIQDMEQGHVIPPLRQIAGGGADSFDKDENWITGKYGGIYEWDSSAGKFIDSLADGQRLTVGDYFRDIGAYRGGFSKIALGFAVSKHADNPEACAKLISYLVSDETAVRTLGTERGVPLNHKAYQICSDAGLLGDITAEAYNKMNDWVTFRIDPAFENAALKGVNGVYEDVFTGISYGDYTVSQGAERLYAGIQAALAGENP
ncbi:MAG: carbohydrate ABC transporter substrate-binding protein [Oscillospiraceae bacterium]|nr:carbohydrate ABC transporter substrate-binding protein [Oscillospiraceae bacterium]